MKVIKISMGCFSMNLFLIFFISAIVFFCLFIFTWIVFGKLIILQIKRWILASKGYVEVEHISPTKVRNYFLMRPSENRFDFSDGFYHYIPECITRKGDILNKYDKSFLSKVPEFSDSEMSGMNDKEKEEYKSRIIAEWQEMRNIYKVINNLKYDPQQLNRKFGMPIITYYGDNPDPINPAIRDKSYGSGVIKDMYLRLLLTQRYKDFKRIIAIMLICLVVIAISNFGFWQNTRSLIEANRLCIDQLNVSSSMYRDLVNATLTAKAQGSNFIIGGG